MTTIPDDMVERVARAICKSKTGEGVHCCQWPGRGGRATCFAAMGNFDDGARAAIEAMQPAVLAERERCARLAEDTAAIRKTQSFDEPDRGKRQALSAQAFIATNIAAAIRSQS